MTAALIPCLVALVTAPCLDDVIAWDAVPAAVTFHVEGRTIQPGVAGIAWTVHTTATSYLVGCQPEAQEVYVWAVDVAGNHSLLPATFVWEPGGFRRLDDSNVLGGWKRAPMCVVAP